jgi:hypothetical protein
LFRHSTNEKYIHTSVLKLSFLVDLQKKVGEVALSIISCPLKKNCSLSFLSATPLTLKVGAVAI